MRIFIAVFFLLIAAPIFSHEIVSAGVQNFSASGSISKKPNPLWHKFFTKQANRKKVLATVLAFPIPGGLLGLHRIYMGTKPYVPLVYIFTLGGGLFILPIIDFCVLLTNKDISRFENNPHIFMWIDNEKKPMNK